MNVPLPRAKPLDRPAHLLLLAPEKGILAPS
jgi:hypothetical protein